MDERKEFEAWMRSREGHPFARQFANLMWAAWQARARLTTDLDEAKGHIEEIDLENHRMRRCVARLMARLTVWLDDDQFNEADGIMTPEFEPPAAPAADAQPVADNDAEWFSLVMGAAAELEDAALYISDPDAKRVALSGAKHYREKAKALPRPLPAPADASPAGDRELDLYDEIECDLPYLFGRASIEGHESGQRLAVQVKEKMRKARAAIARPAAPVAQERSHRAEVSDDALRQGLRTIIEYPVTHTDNMDAMNIKNIALDTLSRAALEQKT